MSEKKISQVLLPDNETYDITLPPSDKNAMFYTTESATANAFTVTIPGITALTDGMIINVKFNAATASGATLNVNNLGAKAIYYRKATAVTSHIVANNYVTLAYEASTGHWVMQFNYDSSGSNTIGYQIRTNSSQWANKTGYTMNRYTLLFEVNGGLSGASTTIATGTSKTTVNFKYIPGGVIKYYSTSGNIANNGLFSAAGLWDQYTIDLQYTFNTGATLIDNDPVYVKMSVNTDGTLSPAYSGSPSHPIVQALPTTEDNYVYVYLGKAYDTTHIELYNNHPMYQYKGGKIVLYSGSSSSGGGTITDVQVNGSSVVSSGVANIVTETAYNASTNKIITKADLNLIKNATLTIEEVASTITFTVSHVYVDVQYVDNITWEVEIGTTWQDLVTAGTKDITNTYIIVGSQNGGVRVQMSGTPIISFERIYTTSAYTTAVVPSDTILEQSYYQGSSVGGGSD